MLDDPSEILEELSSDGPYPASLPRRIIRWIRASQQEVARLKLEGAALRAKLEVYERQASYLDDSDNVEAWG
jgi:hypothetical protein